MCGIKTCDSKIRVPRLFKIYYQPGLPYEWSSPIEFLIMVIVPVRTGKPSSSRNIITRLECL